MKPQLPAVFLSIGFRPFYLGAALFAALSIPLWVSVYIAGVSLPMAYPTYFWHVHEMLFGFGVAVIAGFLLTAVRSWTTLQTPAGGALAMLFAVWLLGRLSPFLESGMLYAVVDSHFLPCLAVCLAIPIYKSRNRRNAFVLVVLGVLWACNLTFHAAVLGHVSAALIQTSIAVAADVVLLLMIVIAGRIIPAFSANAIMELVPWTSRWLEVACIGLVILITILDLANALAAETNHTVYSVLLYAAGTAHVIRLLGWQPWRMRSDVLLLVLPLAYLWIPLHLFVRAYLGGTPGLLTAAAAHALFVGAMSGLMLAMMTRSALGHTGRPLRAGGAEIAIFSFIQCAAIARVFGPWLLPEYATEMMIISAMFWSAAFVTFAAVYAPILIRPRLS